MCLNFDSGSADNPQGGWELRQWYTSKECLIGSPLEGTCGKECMYHPPLESTVSTASVL